MREVSFASSVLHSARTQGAGHHCGRDQVLVHDRKSFRLYGNRNAVYSRLA